jgi:hypothetical protein
MDGKIFASGNSAKQERRRELGADYSVRTRGAAMLRPYTRPDRSGARRMDRSWVGKTAPLHRESAAPESRLGVRVCGHAAQRVAPLQLVCGRGCGWGDTCWMKAWAIGVEGIGVSGGSRDCRNGAAKRVVEQMLSFAWLGGWVGGLGLALGFTLVLFGDRP